MKWFDSLLDQSQYKDINDIDGIISRNLTHWKIYAPSILLVYPPGYKLDPDKGEAFAFQFRSRSNDLNPQEYLNPQLPLE